MWYIYIYIVLFLCPLTSLLETLVIAYCYGGQLMLPIIRVSMTSTLPSLSLCHLSPSSLLSSPPPLLLAVLVLLASSDPWVQQGLLCSGHWHARVWGYTTTSEQDRLHHREAHPGYCYADSGAGLLQVHPRCPWLGWGVWLVSAVHHNIKVLFLLSINIFTEYMLRNV